MSLLLHEKRFQLQEFNVLSIFLNPSLLSLSRLLAMEDELKREQYKMSLIINHKQRVIEAQGQQIAELDAANNRLLNELSSLRNRFELKNGNYSDKHAVTVTEDDDTTNF